MNILINNIMNFKYLKTIKNTIKYWYIQLIVGLIFVGVGICRSWFDMGQRPKRGSF